MIADTDWISKKQNWKNLTSLICIESQRTILQTGETQSQQLFYISSLCATAERFNQIVQQHWAIENKLHWCLDVAFNEDKSTKQAGHAAENFSVITKIAVNLIKADKTKKTSVKNKRLICALKNQFLETLLFKEF